MKAYQLNINHFEETNMKYPFWHLIIKTKVYETQKCIEAQLLYNPIQANAISSHRKHNLQNDQM